MGHGDNHYANLIREHRKLCDIEKVPELVLLKERLARLGLKDPWLRNEVHRFEHKNPDLIRLLWQCFGGTKNIGIGALIAAVGAVVWNKTRPDHHHHGEGDGGHH